MLPRAVRHLSFESELSAPAADVWRVVGTMEGVNAELGPWLRMTTPPAARNLRIEDAPVGEPLFASWILLAGIPIDRHLLKLTSVEPGRGFHEGSTSWLQARWVHVRTVSPTGDGACTLADRLEITPRLRALGPVVERIVGAVFRHRHRQLRRRFGAAS